MQAALPREMPKRYPSSTISGTRGSSAALATAPLFSLMNLANSSGSGSSAASAICLRSSSTSTASGSSAPSAQASASFSSAEGEKDESSSSTGNPPSSAMRPTSSPVSSKSSAAMAPSLGCVRNRCDDCMPRSVMADAEADGRSQRFPNGAYRQSDANGHD